MMREDRRMYDDLPDPSAHPTGWDYAKLDGVWCVGMRGNLDTKYDATIRVTGGFLSDDEAREVAEWITATFNRARHDRNK